MVQTLAAPAGYVLAPLFVLLIAFVVIIVSLGVRAARNQRQR